MPAGIAQSSPAATTQTVLYTAPANKVASGTLFIVNTNPTVQLLTRVSLVNGSGAPAAANYIKYDEQIDWIQIGNILIPAGYTLQVYSSAAGLAYTFSYFEDNNV